jgi:hypothetical protein
MQSAYFPRGRQRHADRRLKPVAAAEQAIPFSRPADA